MIKRSYLWAGVFALAMAGWLASGELLPRLPRVLTTESEFSRAFSRRWGPTAGPARPRPLRWRF